MIEVVFIRHPETEGNVLTNSEMAKLPRPNHLFTLSNKGVGELEAVCAHMRQTMHYPPRAIFHSTAYRTRVLAHAISREHPVLEIIEDSRLNEKWDGIFHSLPEDEIKQRYPEQIEQRNKYGWYHYVPLGGENGPAVEMRIRSFFRDLGENQDYNGGKVVIVGHGNWFHLFEGIARRQTWDQVERERRENPVPNASISIYKFEPPNFFKMIKSRLVTSENLASPKYA